MKTYVIQLDDKYWTGTDWGDATLAQDYFTYAEAEQIVNDLHLPTTGILRIIEEQIKEVYSVDLSNENNTICTIIQKNKVSYDTRAKSLCELKNIYENEFENLKPHHNTEFIEKMLIGYPMNTLILKDNKMPYARNFKTAFDFIDGRIPLSGNYIPELKGVMYEDLPNIYQKRLLSYNFRMVVFE